MKTVYFKGVPCHIQGDMPKVGDYAPAFSLVGKDLSEVKISEFHGKRIVLNIFPSLDTSVCATTVRRFNAEAAHLKNTVVMCVSMDLPFAASRFCVAEGIENVVTASAFRSKSFPLEYGVRIIDGLLAGLLARAVVAIDEHGKVIYTELVDEITHEPDYAALLHLLASE